MTNPIKLLIISAACAAALLSSCKAPRLASLPQSRQLPATYAATPAPDSMNMAQRPRDVFFTDPQLRKVVTDVLDGNPDIHIALQRIRIAGAGLKMSRGAFLPAVYGLAQASGTRFGKYTMEGVGNFDTNLSPNIDDDQQIGTRITPDLWLGVAATWELDLWGKLKQRRIAAQQRYLASEEARRWLNAILVSQTATAYYELLALDKEAKILDEHAAIQERALEIVRVQKEAGRATELAVIQFEAQLLSTRSARFLNRQRIAELTNLINSLAGRYTGEIARSADWPAESFGDRIQAGIPAQLLTNRPDIREASLLLEASQADAKAARAAFFPSLNLSAYTALNSFNTNLIFSLSSLGGQLLAGVTAPIFQRHEIRSRFNIATAEQEQAYYGFQNRTLQAYREVADHLNQMKNSREMLQLKEQQVAALDRGVDVANDLYLNGYANYLEIVTAQKSRLEGQLELINTQRQMALSLVSLYKATGGGWE